MARHGHGGPVPRALPLAALALLAAAPLALADTEAGRGVGAAVFGQSAGLWHRVDVHVPGTGPQAVALALSWGTLPPADFDLTLWTPGAFDDGRLRQDEALATAWTWSTRGPESLSVTLPGGTVYPLTVEPIHSAGNAWRLESTGAGLALRDQPVVGTKLSR